jgi:hypothetical protein
MQFLLAASQQKACDPNNTVTLKMILTLGITFDNFCASARITHVWIFQLGPTSR